MDDPRFPSAMQVIDTSSTAMTGEILFPFAFDEVIGKAVGRGQLQPVVHMWRQQRAFILGARDRKLPCVAAAIDWLERQGYRVAVRNSGGAAVPLDPGVVNISLILPNVQKNRNIQSCFELMAGFIRASVGHASAAVSTGEIRGSYCPGEYDVSIAGKKFCGIAQRRLTNAVIVQAFVLVEGDGAERGSVVKGFYEIASQGAPEADYPKVEPECMASLAQLAGIGTVESYVGRAKEFLSLQGELSHCHRYAAFSIPELDTTIAELQARLKPIK